MFAASFFELSVWLLLQRVLFLDIYSAPGVFLHRNSTATSTLFLFVKLFCYYSLFDCLVQVVRIVQRHMSSISLTPSQASSFRFLDLPPELRLCVYRLAFEDHNEWKASYRRALRRNYAEPDVVSRMFGGADDHKIYVTVPSGPDGKSPSTVRVLGCTLGLPYPVTYLLFYT